MKKNNCFGECVMYVVRRLYGKRIKINTDPVRDGDLSYEQQCKRLSRLLAKRGYASISFPISKGGCALDKNAMYIACVNHLGSSGHAVVCERDNIIFDPSNSLKRKLFFPHDALIILPRKGKEHA